MRALAVAAVLLVACKGEAPSNPAPRQMPIALHEDAAVPDAPTGPILDLVACQPAPLAPNEPTRAQSGRAEHARATLGRTQEGGVRGAADLLKKRQNRLRYCYEQALGRKPDLAGTSQLSIILKETGYPHEVIVENAIDDELSLCLKHIIMELKFAEPAKGKATIVQPVSFEWQPPPPPSTIPEPDAWIPYATTRMSAPTEIAVPAALALQKAMPTAKLATCLTPEHTGTLRVIARIGTDGNVVSARAGGFGDGKAEACIGQTLAGTSTGAGGITEPLDIACDFTRGEPAPWRVALDGGYTVVEAPPSSHVIEDKFRGTLGAQPGKGPPALQPTKGPPAAKPTVWQPDPEHPNRTYLVVIEPDTTPGSLAAGLYTAARGAAFVVAMKVDDKAPLFLLAGRPHSTVADPSTPMLLDARDELRVCRGLVDAPASGTFADAEQLLAGAARRCTRKPCPTLLTITPRKNADELATLIAAARRAGFERIRVGDGACPQ